MGNYDRQTIGGAIAGGTHGTSGRVKADTFTSSVISLQLATPTGIIDIAKRDSVTLGLIGIIVEVELQLVDLYGLRKTSTKVEDVNLHDFDTHDFVMFRYSTGRIFKITFDIIPYQNVHYTIHGIIIHMLIFLRQMVIPILFVSLPILKRVPLPNMLYNIIYTHTPVDEMYYDAYVEAPGYYHYETEWAVPLAQFEQVWKFCRDYPFNNDVVEILLRKSPKDAAYLSPASKSDVIWIDFNIVSNKTTIQMRQDMKILWKFLNAHECLPHWNKLNNIEVDGIDIYNYDLSSISALIDKHDPNRVLFTKYQSKLFD